MRLVIQRSKNSNVKVNEKIVGSIDKGLVILVSFTHSDNETDIDYMVNRVTNLRIFDDEFGVMMVAWTKSMHLNHNIRNG